eukprot:TRINITY_DN10275_c0_g1_i2.p2 TRINITY_DN10275_c0_g1~~TRINITY_DN10275_c0_g1_i2.p2  ORF type:complete len:314 (-),score=80.88 TRINITY_DN10275_c0_g1_i2:57-998(-)
MDIIAQDNHNDGKDVHASSDFISKRSNISSCHLKLGLQLLRNQRSQMEVGIEDRLNMSLDDLVDKSKKEKRGTKAPRRGFSGRGGFGGQRRIVSMDDDDSPRRTERKSSSPYQRSRASSQHKQIETSLRAQVPANSVYVGSLSFDTTAQDLEDHFSQIGDVVLADIFRNHNGRSKGSGLIEFESAMQAQKAIEQLNGSELQGNKIIVRQDRETNDRSSVSVHRENPKRENQSSPLLWVGNIPYDVSWQDLKDYFGQYGKVDRVDILTDTDGRSKGMANLSFFENSAAEKAMRRGNGRLFRGRQIDIRQDRFST